MNDFIIMSRSDLVSEINAINRIMDTDLAKAWSASKIKIIKSLNAFSLKCYDEGEVSTAGILLYLCGFVVSQTEGLLLSVVIALAEGIDRQASGEQVEGGSILDSINQIDLNGDGGGRQVIH